MAAVRTNLLGVDVLADADTGAVSVLGSAGDNGAGWIRADELTKAGMLTRRDYGADTYGAAVYYLAPAELARARADTIGRCSALVRADGTLAEYIGADADGARPCRTPAVTRASSGTYRVPVCSGHRSAPILYRLGSQAFGAHAAHCESEAEYWQHMARERIGPDARHLSGAACLAARP